MGNCSKFAKDFLKFRNPHSVISTIDIRVREQEFYSLHCDHLNDLGLFSLYYVPDIFTIDCPSLESLTLGPDIARARFTVYAPKLLYFEFRCAHVPHFCAGDGFPCIKEVDFDIQITGDDWQFYDEDGTKCMMQRFITMWNAVKGTPLLKLAKETTQVLRRIPDFSEYQPSPFHNLKFLSLRGLSDNPTMSNDHVINYLLKNSPSAEIFTGNIGRIPQLQNKRIIFLGFVIRSNLGNIPFEAIGYQQYLVERINKCSAN